MSRGSCGVGGRKPFVPGEICKNATFVGTSSIDPTLREACHSNRYHGFTCIRNREISEHERLPLCNSLLAARSPTMTLLKRIIHTRQQTTDFNEFFLAANALPARLGLYSISEAIFLIRNSASWFTPSLLLSTLSTVPLDTFAILAMFLL